MSNINQNQHKQIFTIVAKAQSQDQLKLSNSNLVFCSDGKIVNKIPISKIQFVLLVGELTISTQLIAQLAKHQIQVVFIYQPHNQP
jgi:CRISPR/Cas system-associated endonuclease Cas1